MINNKLYKEDIEYFNSLDLPWEKLDKKTVLISGATGMIGSFIIDALLSREDTDCLVVGMGRSRQKADERFGAWARNPRFSFVECDINNAASLRELRDIPANIMFHLASSTHPMQYATDPIGTVTANIIGLNNLLDYGADHDCERFVFASSVEIYGENRGDTDKFAEDYLGYIDCNTVRAGYPEGKRAAEALCQAYISQKDMDVVITRLSRTYGPTILKSDTKAMSQFIKKGVAGEDIVLKSEGTQLYSYNYCADSAAGLLYCLLKGEKGEAYNVADAASDVMLKDIAGMIADIAGTKVVFELPDAVEAAGYSKATKALLDPAKIHGLGFAAGYDIRKGLERTIEILRAEGR